jgi:hypothetical protein
MSDKDVSLDGSDSIGTEGTLNPDLKSRSEVGGGSPEGNLELEDEIQILDFVEQDISEAWWRLQRMNFKRQHQYDMLHEIGGNMEQLILNIGRLRLELTEDMLEAKHGS